MAKLLGTITIIVALILFPPATLALISNNAVPGDTTYPIKRLLENGIFAIASLNSITKAWFSAARSDRRFKEFTTLIAQGKSAPNTLNELVSQTDIAANELAKVEDPVRKEQLAEQLLNSIKKYDQGLEQVSNQIKDKELASNQPQPTTPPITEAVSPPSAVQVTPQPTPTVPAAPTQPKPSTPTQKPSPAPTSTPVPTQKPTPSIQPATPSQPAQGAADAEDIEEARKKIEETKKKVEEEKEKLQKEKEHSDKKEQREVKSKRDKEDENDDDSKREERREKKRR